MGPNRQYSDCRHPVIPAYLFEPSGDRSEMIMLDATNISVLVRNLYGNTCTIERSTLCCTSLSQPPRPSGRLDLASSRERIAAAKIGQITTACGSSIYKVRSIFQSSNSENTCNKKRDGARLAFDAKRSLGVLARDSGTVNIMQVIKTREREIQGCGEWASGRGERDKCGKRRWSMDKITKRVAAKNSLQNV